MVGTIRDVPFFCRNVVPMNELLPEEFAALNDCRHARNEYLHRWLKALCEFPKLWIFCDVYGDFSSGAWAVLLSHRPEFVSHAPLSAFSAGEWRHVLIYQPQLISYCNKWSDFSAAQKAALLKLQPELTRYIKKAP